MKFGFRVERNPAQVHHLHLCVVDGQLGLYQLLRLPAVLLCLSACIRKPGAMKHGQQTARHASEAFNPNASTRNQIKKLHRSPSLKGLRFKLLSFEPFIEPVGGTVSKETFRIYSDANPAVGSSVRVPRRALYGFCKGSTKVL